MGANLIAAIPRRFAVLVSAMWCTSLHAAADAPLQLKLDPALGEARAGVVEGRPMYARGDELSGRPGREVTLQGNAELRKAGTVVRGDRLTYYVPDDEVVAIGNVRIVREGNVFTGPQLRLKMDANEGFFESPSYYLPLYRGRGRAESVEFLGPERIEMRKATYTTCTPDSPDWFLSAETLAINEAQHEGTGRSASLYFKDRKVLAAPLFGFALGDERRSGLLAPTFSLTTQAGAEFVLPYYWNIAPNRDFTLYPRLMARRGIQIGGQMRYLEPRSAGDVRFEYNPNDLVSNSSRYFWSVAHTYANVNGWGGSATLRGVSDDNYFVDYSRSILASSDRVLPRDLIATRTFGNWTVLTRATTYQTILDASASPPYERLPQLSATNLQRDFYGFDAETLVDGTWFRRQVQDAPEGLRMVVYPRVSYPIVRPGWFVIPKLGMHLSAYRLDQNAGRETELNRAVPILSIDSGLVFERPTNYFGRDQTQTLEPRLFYVRSPYRDQSAFPLFDTTVADFNYAMLFTENSFVGNDRIADLNQLTAAVVSRLIEPSTGAESVRVALGQRFYFSDQGVTIPGASQRDGNWSDILLVAGASLGGGMSFDGGLTYAVQASTIPRMTLAWRYQPPDGRIFNAAVRYLKDNLGQIDTSWRWPIAPGWTALGRINYSWLKQRIDPATLSMVDAKPGIIEGVAGFEYTADCWTTRFVLQQFVTAQGESTTAFFLQFELAGLGRIGSDAFDILRRNIPGYRLSTERPTLPSRFFGYE